MRICAVSDVHYKYSLNTPEDQAQNHRVLAFFRSIVGEYDLLVLNGDIFDLWFDWKFCLIKQHFPLLKCFADITEAGCKLVYISGNHDFWFGDFFTEVLRAELVDDRYEIDADGKQMVFTHGDLYTVNDFRYKLFRSIIRLPFMKYCFSVLHPDFALRLGSALSRSSRKRKSPLWLRKKKTAGLELFASKLIQKGKDIVVMGHSHQPDLKDMGKGIYGNSGDWVRHNSYIKIIDGNISLCKFEQQPEYKEKQ